MSDAITALKIQTTIQEAMFSPDTQEHAHKIAQLCGGDREVLEALFMYAGALSSDVAYRVTEILMSESDLEAMANDLRFYQEMEMEIMGE